MAILDLSTQAGRDAANARDKQYQQQFTPPSAASSGYVPVPTARPSMPQQTATPMSASNSYATPKPPKPMSSYEKKTAAMKRAGQQGGDWHDYVNDFNTPTPPMPKAQPVSAMPWSGNGTPVPATPSTSTPFPVKTPEAIAAEAKARTDALLARKTTVAGQTKTGFQTSFDRLKATTQEDRTLADTSFQRQANPFSGATDYAKGMTNMQRERTDREAQQDLATRMANVDMDLADYANANEAERMKMEDEMIQRERQYGIQVDQLALQRKGQEQNQFNADRQFDYGVSRDAVGDSRYDNTTNYNRGRDDILDSRYNDITNYNRGRDTVGDQRYTDQTNYTRSQDKITNNRNAANDALTLRKQHIDEANYYSDKYNIQVDPKDDFQLVLDQVAGKQTAVQQSAAQKAEDAKRADAWKRVEWAGGVQSQADADLLGVPVGTQSQKAKEAAMDAAYKSRTLDISQQNANTSSYNANTSRMNADRQQTESSQPKQQSLTSYTSALNQRYLDRDNQIADRDGLERAILSLPVDEATMTALYNYYGIPMR